MSPNDVSNAGKKEMKRVLKKELMLTTRENYMLCMSVLKTRPI